MQIFTNSSNETSAKDSQGLQEQLASKMMGMFDAVAEERGKFYARNQNKIPDQQSVQAIINSYANQNLVISGGASLIPGPWGMAAAIPEIAMIVRNQIAMIYDIGVAYGKGKRLDRELLASVFAFSLGTGGLGLLAMQGSKVLVKRASLKAFQKIVQLLAGKVTQRLLKSMVSKWLPVIGAAAMAAWSNFSTREIGKKAIEIFQKDIEYMPDTIENISFENSERTDLHLKTSVNVEAPKIQTLINLMKVDGQAKPVEQEYIREFIKKSDVSDEERLALLRSINGSNKSSVDYIAIANSPDDAVGLLIDLIALSKRDNQFHISEKMYVKQVGKSLGFSEGEVEELIAA